jgi:hypothetical protein
LTGELFHHDFSGVLSAEDEEEQKNTLRMEINVWRKQGKNLIMPSM